MPQGLKRPIRRAPKSASRYEEEDEPRSRRRRDEDDEPEEERRPRRSRARDDDEDEEERPRSRRRSRDEDDDEDEEPRSRRRSRRDEDEDDDEDDRPRSRRRRSRDDDDDDDDDRPRSRRKSRRSRDDEDDDEDGLLAEGWEGADRVRKEASDGFANDFQVGNDNVIIKFLDDGPIASYKQHWAEWLPQGSKLSYVCVGEDCPICDAGDKPQAKFAFRILDFTDPKHPVVAVWRVGIKLYGVIKKAAQTPRSSPINRPDLYFEAEKTGGGGGRRSGGRVQTNLHPVKARELYEDFKVEPLEDDELEAFEKKAPSKKDLIQISSVKELEKVADAIED